MPPETPLLCCTSDAALVFVCTQLQTTLECFRSAAGASFWCAVVMEFDHKWNVWVTVFITSIDYPLFDLLAELSVSLLSLLGFRCFCCVFDIV